MNVRRDSILPCSLVPREKSPSSAESVIVRGDFVNPKCAAFLAEAPALLSLSLVHALVACSLGLTLAAWYEVIGQCKCGGHTIRFVCQCKLQELDARLAARDNARWS